MSGLIAIALRTNAPRRLLKLYWSLSGATGESGQGGAGSETASTTGTPPAAGDSGEAVESSAPDDASTSIASDQDSTAGSIVIAMADVPLVDDELDALDVILTDDMDVSDAEGANTGVGTAARTGPMGSSAGSGEDLAVVDTNPGLAGAPESEEPGLASVDDFVVMNDAGTGYQEPDDVGVMDVGVDAGTDLVGSDDLSGWTVVVDSNEEALEEAGLTGDDDPAATFPEYAEDDAPDRADAGQLRDLDDPEGGSGRDPGARGT